MTSAAAAFVPGHVTVFFSPQWHDDPARTGSTGAGLTLADGVSVRFEVASSTAVTVNGDAVEVEPVERVLDALAATGRVAIQTSLILGEGFGVSGAMALGTALAVNRALDGARSENELIAVAHAAEVESNTGLGDVVAQARGGIPIRLAPGAPPHGELDGVPAVANVEYRSFGEISTADIITADVTALQAAGERALAALRAQPTLDSLFAAGRRFARETDLLTPRVDAVIDDVQAAGGQATMGMLGETVVALDSGLTDAGYEANSSETHPSGSSLRR